MNFVQAKKLSLEYPIKGVNFKFFHNRPFKSNVGGIYHGDSNSKSYINALSDISFYAPEGERIGLIGHNGAGKSTLLRLIGGIYTPSSGHLEVKGRVSSIFELGTGVDLNLTSYENILRVLMFNGYDYKNSLNLVDKVIEYSEIDEFVYLPTKALSTGMRLRVMFAIAIHIDFDILCIDEVITVGDKDFQKKTIETFEHLIDKSKILFLASHLIEYQKKFCNTFFYMEKGMLKKVDKLEHI
jgi:ABC-type polysaccharide/polyol phosphate transport system ATPase subunit